MSEPAAKKQRAENGEAIVPAAAVAASASSEVAPAAVAASSAAAPASATPAAAASGKPVIGMRDDMLNLQLIKQGAEGVRHDRAHETRRAMRECAGLVEFVSSDSLFSGLFHSFLSLWSPSACPSFRSAYTRARSSVVRAS